MVDVLADLMPEVRSLARGAAFEAILDDPALLYRCFVTFRANPERFRHLLIDRHHVPVAHAEAILQCGRSLDDVMAMIVRTCAKRHFRRRLDGGVRPLKRRAPEAGRRVRAGLVEGVRRMLPFGADDADDNQPTPGEILYEAFKAFLRHDWQVPLVPEYSLLAPQTVRRLGIRILDYRLAEDIRSLRAGGMPPPSAAPRDDSAIFDAPAGLAIDMSEPEFVIPAELRPKAQLVAATKDERARIDDVLVPDGSRLRPSAFTMVLLEPELRSHLRDGDQMVRATGLLGSVGGLAVKMLVGELGLRKDQLALLLLGIHETVGDANFQRLFGLPGNADAIGKLIVRAKAANLGQHMPLADVAAFIRRTFLKG